MTCFSLLCFDPPLYLFFALACSKDPCGQIWLRQLLVTSARRSSYDQISESPDVVRTKHKFRRGFTFLCSAISQYEANHYSDFSYSIFSDKTAPRYIRLLSASWHRDQDFWKPAKLKLKQRAGRRRRLLTQFKWVILQPLWHLIISEVPKYSLMNGIKTSRAVKESPLKNRMVNIFDIPLLQFFWGFAALFRKKTVYGPPVHADFCTATLNVLTYLAQATYIFHIVTKK